MHQKKVATHLGHNCRLPVEVSNVLSGRYWVGRTERMRGYLSDPGGDASDAGILTLMKR